MVSRLPEARPVPQKWQCVEDASGTLKLHKCKGPVRFGGGSSRALSNLVPKYYGQSSEACSCDSVGDYRLGLAGRRKLFKKSKCHSPGQTRAAVGAARARGHVTFQTIPQMFVSRHGCCPRSKGHSQTPHKPPFKRSVVLR